MKSLVVVCLVMLSSAASAQTFVGRWYSGNVKECKGHRGATQGLLVYSQTELVGLENTCRIVSAKPKSSAIEMNMRCRGEGMVSIEKETVEVSGNKLHRTVIVERKPMKFTYTRCP